MARDPHPICRTQRHSVALLAPARRTQVSDHHLGITSNAVPYP
jgi:hypothetical protein